MNRCDMNRLWVHLSAAFGLVTLVAVLILFVGMQILEMSFPTMEGAITAFLTQPDGPVSQMAAEYEARGEFGDPETLVETSRHYADTLNADVQFAVLDADKTLLFATFDGPIQVEEEITIPIGDAVSPYGYFQVLVSGCAPCDQGRGVMLVALALGCSLCILVGVLVSRTVTRSLNRLALAARAFRDHDWNYRAEKRGSLEMIEVAEAFNEMADALQDAETLRRNLVADVAHELRTPLAVLQSKLYGILDDVYPLEKAEIARLYDQTRLLSRLVNDLLELSKAEAHQLLLDRKPTDLKPVIEDAMLAFKIVAQDKHIRFRLDIADTLPCVEVDEQRIHQVIYNLVNNAIRHTPDGGEVSIMAGQDGDSLRITVQDTGDGIRSEYLPHVFERFYRVDSSRQRASGGSGLGLAIAHAIVTAHNGTVTAASDGIPGKGATFTVYLPILLAELT